MSNAYQFLTYEEVEGVGILKINREDKLNALNRDVIEELISFFQKVETLEKGDLKGIIFTGTGSKAFIAGADIASMQTLSVDEATNFAKRGQELTLLIENCSFPVIAAVNGFALGGGCEMAMSCDFIIASENAMFGLPEVTLGLIPGFGGTQRLARYVGKQRAKELSFSGRMVKAEEAKIIGLCLEVVSENLIDYCVNFIKSFKKASPLAISVAKEALNKGIDLEISKGLEIEAASFGKLFDSADTKEGIAAFLEKRRAAFTGQ